jgi:hypothetical protein
MLTEIGVENNTSTIVMIPSDIITSLASSKNINSKVRLTE